MKICEAFRKEWESSWITTEEHRGDLRNEIRYMIQTKKGLRNLDPESDEAYFLGWYEGACSITATMLTKRYGITREAIEAAVAAGFIKVNGYKNAMTRAGLALTDPVTLTAKGKKAIIMAYPTWKP